MTPDFSASFLSAVRKFISEENLFAKEEKLLCAVSGGVDSMVLAFALLELGFDFEIAHFNYGLRGKDSDRDEELVRNWADRHQIPFHRNSPGPDFRLASGTSLQEEARNLRYSWMEQICRERGIRHLVLGHHADDQLETLFLNLLRGAGLSGMRGMLPAQGLRKRPLLSTSRADILGFARQHSIEWAEDISNAKNDYRRNQLRNQILPLLQEMAPGFDHAMLRTGRRFRLYETTLENLFNSLLPAFLKSESDESQTIDLALCLNHPQGEFFFFEWLKKEGFSFEESAQLRASVGSTESIRRTASNGNQVEIKYPKLIRWKTRPQMAFPELTLAEPASLPFPGQKTLTLRHRSLAGMDLKKTSPWVWISDPEKLSFPLRFRHIENGDWMKPLGMGGKRKKLSDLLTEAGLSNEEKSRQPVMVDAKGIILWVPGIRSSEVSRLKEGYTGNALVLEVGPTPAKTGDPLF